MLPDIRPGNTKILYFFNCLLDGMHTIGGFYFRLFIHTDVYLSLTEGVSLPVANLFILPCYMSPFSTKSEP